MNPLGKQEMMENFDRLNTRGISREQALSVAVEAERSRDFSPTIAGVTVGLSSGTSGSRGIFMASPWEQWMYAGTALAKILPGFWRRKNRVAFFLRANNNLYTAVRSRVLQFEYFDLLRATPEHVGRLNEVQPTLLIAPPSLLRQLAELKDKGELKISPGKIISVAEVLDPQDEKFIADSFGRKIHQIYQATEGFLAATCELGVLHLNEDLMIVEKDWLDREQGKFQPIITDFSRKSQPIVRYRLNDVLTLKKETCACGSPMTALRYIEGRADDVFELPSVTGAGVVTVFPDFIRRAVLFASDRIVDFRVTQTGAAEIEVRAVVRGSEDEIRESIRREFRELGSSLKCDFQRVHIVFETRFEKPEAGRKLRRVINAFKHPASFKSSLQP